MLSIIRSKISIISFKIFSKLFHLLVWMLWGLSIQTMHANPIDGVVSAGQATINSQPNYMEITQQSERAVIDWGKFDIAANEHTNFQQPSSNAVTLNRIHSDEASNINGRLTANGKLILVNQNGIMFGRDSKVDVNGLLATTSNISNQRFMAGVNKQRQLLFDQAGSADAAIVNEGEINAAKGLVGLVAPRVVNTGIITAKLGKVALATGDQFTVDLYGDQLLNIAVSDEQRKQLLINAGEIIADGGEILLTGSAGKKIVNNLIINSGVLAARHVEERDGKIIIFAEGSNAVKGNVSKDKGKKQGQSGVLIKGLVDVSGLNPGEKGGKLHISGDEVVITDAIINASGYEGKAGTTVGLEKSAKRIGSAGGEILIGGDYLGKGKVPAAERLLVDRDVVIFNDAIDSGDAGRNIFWSDGVTSFHGKVFGRALGGKGLSEAGRTETESLALKSRDNLEIGDVNGFCKSKVNPILGGNVGDGGFVETSGKKKLEAGGYVNLLASNGATGTYLLDPSTVNIYGNFNPKFVSTDGSLNLPTNLKVWLDFSDQSKVLLTYQTVLSGSANSSITVSGTSGSNTLVASNATNLIVGSRIMVGKTGIEYANVTETADGIASNSSNIYTITAKSSNTLTVTPALKQTFAAGTVVRQGYISKVEDKSGLQNNASPVAIGSSPIWLDKIQNNLGIIQFVRGVEYLSVKTEGLTGASALNYISNQIDFSYFVGYKRNVINGVSRMVMSIGNSSGWHSSMSLGRNADTAGVVYAPPFLVGVDNLGYRAWGDETKLNNTSSHIVDIVSIYNTTNNVNQLLYRVYNDGTLASVDSPESYSYSIKNIFSMGANGYHFLGARGQPDGSGITPLDFFIGNIYEEIEYDTVISDIARNLIEQYKSSKWNIALTSTVPTSNYAVGANGDSNFTASYLQKLSLTADINIVADNVNLDLQNSILEVVADKNFSVKAMNSLNVLSNGTINTTRSTTKGTINIELNNGNLDLGQINLNANNGGTINITNTDGHVKLGNLTAGKIYVASGNYGDIIIPNGKTITATSAGTAITLNSGRNFKNYTTNNPLILTNTPARWLIYTCHPLANLGVDIDGSNINFSSSTYNSNFNYYYTAGVEPADNLNYIFYKAQDANRVVTITPNIPEKLGYSFEYGTTFNAPFFDYTVSGYVGDDQSNDQIYQRLLYTTNYTEGNNIGNYNIYINPDEVSSKLGYYIQLDPVINPNLNNTINVYPRAVTITPRDNQSKIYSKNPSTDPALTYDVTSGSIYKNTLILNLTRESGEDVANNYKIMSGIIDNPNYAVTFDGSKLFAINPKPIVCSLNAITKTYDGTSDTPVLTFTNYTNNTAGAFNTTAGVVSGDTVRLTGNYTAGKYYILSGGNKVLEKNKGGSKIVEVTGLTVDNSNYSIASTISATVGTINAKPVTVTVGNVTVISKQYDRLSSVIITPSNPFTNFTYAIDPSSIIGTENVTLTIGTLSGTYNNANVATGKTITIGGFTLGGADAANYSVTVTVNTGEITPKPLDVSLTSSVAGAVAKSYNGTNTITASTLLATHYTNNTSAVLNATAGVISGDSVTLTGYTTGTYDTKDVGTNKLITTTGLGVTNANYSISNLSANIGTINPVQLTVTPTVAITKVYDGTTNVDLTGKTYTLAGVITTPVNESTMVSLDSSLATSGTYADKNVGTNKTITINSFGLTGSGASNYLAPTGATGAITAKPLTAVLTDINNGVSYPVTKIYNRTTAATLVASNYLLPGVISPDVVSLATIPTAGTYTDSFNVGTGKPVTSATGLTLTGANAGNYSLSITSASGNIGIITPKPLTTLLTGTVTKSYNGNPTATLAITNYTNITSGALNASAGVISGDTATLTGYTTGVYADKNVGTGKTITVTTLGLTGTGSSNYSIGTVSGNIGVINNPIALTAVLNTNITKNYDGSNLASLTNPDLSKNYSLTNLISGDAVILNATSGAYNSKTASDTYTNTITFSGLSLSGADSINYTLSNSTVSNATGRIIKASLTPVLNANITKSYDGTNTAFLINTDSTKNYSLNGLVTYNGVTDNVILTAAGGFYNDKNVNANKTITFSGLTISGADSGNYNLSSTSANSNSGVIQAINLTPVLNPTKFTKQYDGTDGVILNGNYSFIGLQGSDQVTLIADNTSKYDNKLVGANKNVTLNGLYITGVDSTNYNVTTTSLTSNVGEITSKTLTPVINDNITKLYDGSDTIGLTNADGTIKNYSLNGIITYNGYTDQVDLITTSGNYNDKTVGSNKTITFSGLSLGGVDSINYNLASSSVTNTKGIIQSISLTPVLNSSINKVYDGTTNVDLTNNYSLPGVITYNGVTDIVGLAASSGGYETKDVGDNKQINLSGLYLTGRDAGNYIIAESVTAINGIGAIIAKELTATVNASSPAISREYNGTDIADVTAVVYDLNKIGTEDVTINKTNTVGRFADSQASATSKTITITGLALTGTAKANYTLSSSTATTSGFINYKSLTATINASSPAISREYNGTDVADVTAVVYDLNKIGTEDVTINKTNTVGRFADSQASATSKTITITGLALTGTAKANYTLSSSTATTSGLINYKSLTATINASSPAISREYNGTDVADVTAVVYDLNKIGTEDVTINKTNTVGRFADSQASATSKTITITGLALTGTAKANYTLSSSTATTSGLINYKSLTATINASSPAISREYNGTDIADVTGVVYDLNKIGTEDVTINKTNTVGRFADSQASATSKTITITGLALTGTAKANYTLSSSTATTSGLINYKSLTATINASSPAISREYNGTDIADVTGVVYDLNKIGTEDVTINKTNTVGKFADSQASATSKTITITGLALTGTAKANYILPVTSVTTSGMIDKKPLTVTLTGTVIKPYDTTTAVTLTDANYAPLAGIYANDNVQLQKVYAGNFDNPNVGRNKLVTVEGLNLTGTDAGNYSLATSASGEIGEITSQGLTPIITKIEIKYGSAITNNITVTGYTGYVAPDSYAQDTISGTYTITPNYSAGNNVGLYSVNFTPNNLTSAKGYTINPCTVNDVIKVIPLPIDIIPKDANKVYGEIDRIFEYAVQPEGSYGVANLQGNLSRVAGETVFSGPYPITQGGITNTNNPNYAITFVPEGKLTISPKVVTVDLQNVTKTYDSTKNIIVDSSNFKFNGIVNNDVVNVDLNIAQANGSYDDNKNVAEAKPITINNLLYTGKDILNYNLPTTVRGTGNITAKSLTATINSNSPEINKVYDGNDNADVTKLIYNLDKFADDQVTINAADPNIQGKYEDLNVSDAIKVNITGLRLSGQDKDNYILNNTSVTQLNSKITAKPLNIDLTGTVIKTYDENDAATLTYANYTNTDPTTGAINSAAGLVNADLASLVSGTYEHGTYDDKNAAVTNIVVRISGVQVNNRNYQISALQKDIGKINPKPLTVNLTGTVTKPYDGNNIAHLAYANYSNTDPVTGKITGSLAGVVGSDEVFITGYSVGEYDNKNCNSGKTVTVYNLGVNNPNYSVTPNLSADLGAITQIPITAKLNDNISKIYDGNLSLELAGNYRLDGLITYNDATDEVGLTASSGGYKDKTADKNKIIEFIGLTISGQDSGNYNLTNIDQKVVSNTGIIAKKDLTAELNSIITKEYDGTKRADLINQINLTKNYRLVDSFNHNGVIELDEVNLVATLGEYASKDVGENKQIVSFSGLSLIGLDANNYNLLNNNISAPVGLITPKIKDLTVSLQNATKIYDNTKNVILNSSNFKITGILNNDIVNVDINSANASGNYADSKIATNIAITIDNLRFTGKDAVNYNLPTTLRAQGDITHRPLTISAIAATKVYGSSDRSLNYTIKEGSLLPGDSIVGTLVREPGESVANSPYAITQGSITAGDNYIISYKSADFTITPKILTILADRKFKRAGELEPALTYSYQTTDLVKADFVGIFRGGLTRSPGETVGNYPITKGDLSAGDNYVIDYQGANLEVIDKGVIVTARSRTKTYGELEPENSIVAYDVAGLAAGSSISGTLLRIGDLNVGRYKLEEDQQNKFVVNPSSSGPVYYNYDYLTVNPKELTITANSGAKVYGAQEPELTYDAEGLITGDSLTGSLSRQAGENVGIYEIGLGNLINPNYTIIYEAANFAITPKTLKITANNHFKLLGSDDPVFSYSYDLQQLVNPDQANILQGNLSRDPGQEDVGEYPIFQGDLTAGNNYVIDYHGENAKLHIIPEGIVITAKSAAKTYGEQDPSFMYDVIGLPVGTSLTGILTRTIGEDAGYYSIEGGLSSSSNDDIYYNSAAFSIERKNLTAALISTVNHPIRKIYDGTKEAILSSANYNLMGMLNSDDITIANTNGSYSDANVGDDKTVTVSYPKLSGTKSSNYVLNGPIVGAVGSIAHRTLKINSYPQTKLVGGADPILTYKVSGLIPGDVISGRLSREVGENIGSYGITQGTLAAENYVIEYKGDVLMINSIPVVSQVYPTVISPVAPSNAPNAFTSAQVMVDKSSYLGSFSNVSSDNMNTAINKIYGNINGISNFGKFGGISSVNSKFDLSLFSNSSSIIANNTVIRLGNTVSAPSTINNNANSNSNSNSNLIDEVAISKENNSNKKVKTITLDFEKLITNRNGTLLEFFNIEDDNDENLIIKRDNPEPAATTRSNAAINNTSG